MRDAECELKAAQIELQKEIDNYLAEARIMIDENNKTIEKLKSQSTKAGDKTADAYKSAVDKLMKKNADLQVKLDESVEDSEEGWADFKTEFNRDMNTLGTSIADLIRDNEKKVKK